MHTVTINSTHHITLVPDEKFLDFAKRVEKVTQIPAQYQLYKFAFSIGEGKRDFYQFYQDNEKDLIIHQTDNGSNVATEVVTKENVQTLKIQYVIFDVLNLEVSQRVITEKKSRFCVIL